MEQNEASESIRAANREFAASLPFEDTRDLEAADRGFVVLDRGDPSFAIVVP